MNRTDRSKPRGLTLVVAIVATLALSILGAAAAEAHGDRAQHRAEKLKKYDKNGDGKLDDQERQQMQQEHESRHKERSAARFKLIDADGDGVITLEEFQNAPRPQHGDKPAK